jgi:endonuclease/exonuclease/phosphatase family metal-dependent hydrolase
LPLRHSFAAPIALLGPVHTANCAVVYTGVGATAGRARTGVVARVRCVPGELLTIASLNTRGIPLTGSYLAERYAVIVVCGDFNVSRESSLFGEFTAGTGLADAFGGACPATFRAEYLPADATPHCIDFILTAGEVKAESAELVFAEKEPLGYVSDHIGLRVRLSLTPGTPGRGRFARP